MPLYDYLCSDCGPFVDTRRMAECDHPQACPRCGESSPRALLTAPRLSCVAATTRTALGINERSAHAPQTLDQYKASHGPGCGCCVPQKKGRPVSRSRSGAKSFPSARPWMISH